MTPDTSPMQTWDPLANWGTTDALYLTITDLRHRLAMAERRAKNLEDTLRFITEYACIDLRMELTPRTNGKEQA